MSILQALIDLVGPVPNGYEVVAWIAAAIVLLFMLSCSYKILGAIVRMVTGGR